VSSGGGLDFRQQIGSDAAVIDLYQRHPPGRLPDREGAG